MPLFIQPLPINLKEWHLRKELQESCITWLFSPYFFTQEAVLKKERGSVKSQDFSCIIFNLRKFKSGWFAWNPHMLSCCHGVWFSKSLSQKLSGLAYMSGKVARILTKGSGSFNQGFPYFALFPVSSGKRKASRKPYPVLHL